MKKTLSIIPADNKVYIDGEGRSVDCSGIPDDIHAIQWDEGRKTGWIEYVPDPSTPPWDNKPHKPLKDVRAYASLMEAWEFVMSDADVRAECAVQVDLLNVELRIKERDRDGLAKDQLLVEKKALEAKRDAIHAKYRKAEG